jgi:hypothetical protein
VIRTIAHVRIVVSSVLVLGLCVGAPAWSAADAGVIGARSFEVRYRPLTDAVELVSAVLSEVGTVSLQPRLRRIVVQDRAEVLDRVAQVLEDFDLPPRNVEVSVSLFLGTDRRDEEAGRLAHPPEVAEETRGIRETLGDFTKWTEFSPLGSRTITCVEGFPGTVYLADDYRVEFHVDSVQGEDRVTFDRFTLMKVVRTADGQERVVPHYDAAIHIPVGKELLVGAASGPDSSAALFLKLLVRVR